MSSQLQTAKQASWSKNTAEGKQQNYIQTSQLL